MNLKSIITLSLLFSVIFLDLSDFFRLPTFKENLTFVSFRKNLVGQAIKL